MVTAAAARDHLGPDRHGIDALNVLNKVHDARSPMLRGVTGAFLATLTVAGGFAVANHKTVTLTIDGAPMTVQTMKTRIGDVARSRCLRPPRGCP